MGDLGMGDPGMGDPGMGDLDLISVIAIDGGTHCANRQAAD